VRLAAQDPQRRPVLISGEPGLEKDNLAALIHYGSAQRQQLILRFDGALLKADGSEVFGTGPDAVELPLLELARSGQWCAGGITQTFAGRLFFTAESSLPALDRGCTLIRVPPLRVRRQGQDWPAVLPDDVFWTAPRQQRLAEMRADEAGRAGDQHLAHGQRLATECGGHEVGQGAAGWGIAAA
jgi:hypothetical protein